MIRRCRLRACAIWFIAVAGCGGTLDAGADAPHGPLPVDERNPVILNNDGPTDNWQGEFALLLASARRLELVGIVINDSSAWPDLGANLTGWNELVAAARASGMRNAPDPLASAGAPLARPLDGNIDATIPNVPSIRVRRCVASTSGSYCGRAWWREGKPSPVGTMIGDGATNVLVVSDGSFGTFTGAASVGSGFGGGCVFSRLAWTRCRSRHLRWSSMTRAISSAVVPQATTIHIRVEASRGVRPAMALRMVWRSKRVFFSPRWRATALRGSYICW